MRSSRLLLSIADFKYSAGEAVHKAVATHQLQNVNQRHDGQGGGRGKIVIIIATIKIIITKIR